jgi:hypothetical protein
MKNYLPFLLVLLVSGCIRHGYSTANYKKFIGFSTQDLVYELGPPTKRYTDPDVGLVYEYQSTTVDDGGYFMDNYEPPTQSVNYVFFYIEGGKVVRYNRRSSTTL